MEIDVANRDLPAVTQLQVAAPPAPAVSPPKPPAMPAPPPPAPAVVAKPAVPATELLKQQIKLGVALKKAQDARLQQLRRQLEAVRHDLEVQTLTSQKRAELQEEARGLESKLAVRQQYVDKCTQLKEQGRDPELPALIFYQGLDAYCGDEDAYNPHIRREYRYVGKRGTVEQQDLELLEIATNLVAQPGITGFSDYTAMFPKLLKNHCADDEAAKADFEAKERLRKEAERNAQLRLEQESWWERVGAKQQLKVWWHQTALPLLEREKAATNYLGKPLAERAKLAQRILKSVGMALSQSWLREKMTSQLGPYPPFWPEFARTGVYTDSNGDAGVSETIRLDDVLPGWDWTPPPSETEAAQPADGGGGGDVAALLAEIQLLRQQNAKLARLEEARLDTNLMLRSKSGDLSAAARRGREMEKQIESISKKLSSKKQAVSDEKRQRLEAERDHCIDVLRDSLDLVKNKFARKILVS